MNDGGNNEFQLYKNSRKNSFVKDGVLYLKPTLTADDITEDVVKSGIYVLDGCTDEQGSKGC